MLRKVCMAFIGLFLALEGTTTISVAQETISLETTTSKVSKLQGASVAGPLPRPLLMLRLYERGENFMRDPATTSIHIFDPFQPNIGFRKVFSGPGENQYFRFVTPLFGGCGVAVGNMDAQTKPAGPRKMFWLDLLKGQMGETIAYSTIRERLEGLQIAFESTTNVYTSQNRVVYHINQYDLASSAMCHYSLPLLEVRPIREGCTLAVADIGSAKKILKINTQNAKAEVLGIPPVDYWSKFSIDQAAGIYPAGRDCLDGLYCIHNFSLWYLPNGGEWRSVIKNVHIVKTFGGALPHLPVAYVGNGRFAVTRTVKDEVQTPKRKVDEGYEIPKALACTMLVEAQTGKILKETEPEIYDFNPRLAIPDDWWSMDIQPQRKAATEAQKLFHWDADSNMVGYGKGKSIRLAKEMKTCLSADGRYLLIYQQQSKINQTPARMSFEIVDGATARTSSYEVKSDAKQLFVGTAAWQVLCSDTLDNKNLREFKGAGYD